MAAAQFGVAVIAMVRVVSVSGFPLAPGGLDGGEHLRFPGGLGFHGTPDRGELPVPIRSLLVSCAAPPSWSARMALTWALRSAVRMRRSSSVTCGGAQAVSRS